jgi:hypothetical protein
MNLLQSYQRYLETALQLNVLIKVCGSMLVTLLQCEDNGTIVAEFNEAKFRTLLEEWAEEFGKVINIPPQRLSEIFDNAMNPNATPENIAAAEQVIRQQTDDTVAAMEAHRVRRPQVGPEALSHVLDVVAQARDQMIVAGKPVLRVKGVVHQIHKEHDQGHPDLQISELIDFRASYNETVISPQVHLSIFTSEPEKFGLFKEGSEFYIDLVPVAVPPPPPAVPAPGKEHLRGTASTAAGFGVADGTDINAGAGPVNNGDGNPDHGRKGFNAEQEAARKAMNTPIASAPPITGTTGSHGPTDPNARLNQALGGAPNAADPNLTGPTSDANQPEKPQLEGDRSGEGEPRHLADGNEREPA